MQYDDFCLGLLVHLEEIRIKFVYRMSSDHDQGQVTGAKKTRYCLFPQCKTLMGNNSRSITGML